MTNEEFKKAQEKEKEMNDNMVISKNMRAGDQLSFLMNEGEHNEI